MMADVACEGAGLDVGYLARRSLAATRSLAVRHMGNAVCAQVVCGGRYAPSGRGQSQTADFKARMSLAEAFCEACRGRCVDVESPSERVCDVVCYMGPGERGRADSVAALAELQERVRDWALSSGHTLAIGLHALECAGSERAFRKAHLHMVGIDCEQDLRDCVLGWADGRDDVSVYDVAGAGSVLLG